MKNYLIIGASSGIGKSLSKTLALNHKVWGTYNTRQIENDNSKMTYHPLDITQQNIDLSFVPEKIDGLAYCPGKINLKPFSRLTTKDFIDDFQIQLLGAVKVIQGVLPNLKQSNNASIILFSTVAVQTGFNFHSLVASSKGAIEGLTRALAAEFAPKIRVNAIAPSLTDTPLASHLINTQEKKEANAQRHPLKKIGTSQDVANAATFLLTDDSNWMTGQIISLDGGISSVRT